MREEEKRHRRMVGALVAWLPKLELWKVEDPRSRHGRRWKLPTFLTAVLAGLLAERKSLAQVESFVAEMSSAARAALKLPAQLADTTLRDTLVRLTPFELRQVLHRMVKAALRGGKLALTGFPFHVLVLDGKATSVPSWDDHYAQRKTYDDGRKAHGLVRLVTAMLGSCRAKPIVDAFPIPAETNEMGIFPAVFESLCRVYGGLFKLVTYDAGANSLANARLVAESGKYYLFQLKQEARFLMQRLVRCVGPSSGEVIRASTSETLSDKSTVRRTLYLRQAKKGFKDWGHLRTALRVRSETFNKHGVLIATLDRYFISNLVHTELSFEQWLALVRCHWAVENNGHWTLDAIFEEDEHPWIEASPKGTVAMMLLRRVAYNIATCFRCVTQRSEERKSGARRHGRTCCAGSTTPSLPHPPPTLRAFGPGRRHSPQADSPGSCQDTAPTERNFKRPPQRRCEPPMRPSYGRSARNHAPSSRRAPEGPAQP